MLLSPRGDRFSYQNGRVPRREQNTRQTISALSGKGSNPSRGPVALLKLKKKKGRNAEVRKKSILQREEQNEVVT